MLMYLLNRFYYIGTSKNCSKSTYFCNSDRNFRNKSKKIFNRIFLLLKITGDGIQYKLLFLWHILLSLLLHSRFHCPPLFKMLCTVSCLFVMSLLHNIDSISYFISFKTVSLRCFICPMKS